jgi:hypothetical protein
VSIAVITSCLACGFLGAAIGVVIGAKRADRVTAVERDALSRLRDHVSELSTFARTRIKDGEEIGANVWRIALEEVAREADSLRKLGMHR